MKAFRILGNSKKKPSNFLKFYEEYFKDVAIAKEQKSYGYWRETIRDNPCFDQLFMGIGCFKAMGMRDIEPSYMVKGKDDRIPISGPELIEYLKNACNLLRGSGIDSFLILKFYHNALFLKQIQSELCSHFLKTISRIKDPKSDLFEDNLLVAMFERSVYYGGI